MVYLPKVRLPLFTISLLTNLRTVARAEQLEGEERNGTVRRSTSELPGSFSDDPNEQDAAATLLLDDQIDFLDPEAGRDGYQDEFSDDDDDNNDPFRHGDGGGEEGSISLSNQPPAKR